MRYEWGPVCLPRRRIAWLRPAAAVLSAGNRVLDEPTRRRGSVRSDAGSPVLRPRPVLHAAIRSTAPITADDGGIVLPPPEREPVRQPVLRFRKGFLRWHGGHRPPLVAVRRSLARCAATLDAGFDTKQDGLRSEASPCGNSVLRRAGIILWLVQYERSSRRLRCLRHTAEVRHHRDAVRSPPRRLPLLRYHGLIAGEPSRAFVRADWRSFQTV